MTHLISKTAGPMAGLLTLLLFAGAAAAQSLPVPAPPQVAAPSYILVDFDSGKVIAETDADQRIEPASITKLMTSYIVLRELSEGKIQLGDPVGVSERAWRMPGSRTFIEVGDKVPVEVLLKGMIIQSGNDASVALAEHVAGSEAAFAELMNHQAGLLGLTATHYTNSTGLPDPEHYTSARDIAMLSSALIRDFPEGYRWYSEKQYAYNGISQYNRNKLLWRDPSVDGVKTGHTESAGYGLVASAKRDGMRLISVVVGTDGEETRARASQTLLNYGFRFFETHRLYAAGDALARARIWKGANDELPLGLASDLFVTIPRGNYRLLKATMDLKPDILAPASKGQEFGVVTVSLQGETQAQRPLVALADVGVGNFFQRIVDEMRLWFN